MGVFYGRKLIHCMTANLKLNLSDALNSAELEELTGIATREQKPLERVLFEAARDLVLRRRAARATANGQPATGHDVPLPA
jgi:hypothetical protein